MTPEDQSNEPASQRGELRRAATRVMRMDRFPILPTEQLTATEKASAQLALSGDVAALLDRQGPPPVGDGD